MSTSGIPPSLLTNTLSLQPPVNSSDGPPSPSAPPFSPITPEMSNAQVAGQHPPAGSNAPPNGHTNAIPPASTRPSHSYAHSPADAPFVASSPAPMPPPVRAPLPSTAPPASTARVPPPPPAPRAPSPKEPSPQPIDISTNTDAIAMKAAMSILSMQRGQAIRDMQTLEKQKELALQNPAAFAEALKTGQVKMRNTAGTGLDFNYPASDDEDSESSHAQAPQQDAMNIDSGTPSNQANHFGDMPTPQDVVRAPPVNWNKYHIVGSALDQLHEQQRRNPDEGRPRTDEDVRMEQMRHLAAKGQVPGRKGAREVMAPYDPFKDEIVRKGALAGGQGQSPTVAKTGPGNKKKGAAAGGSAKKKGKARTSGSG